jgi:thiol-disulfide isomerase/thioredoxin
MSGRLAENTKAIHMRKLLLTGLATLLILLSSHDFAMTDNSIPLKGEKLPSISLPIPGSPEEKAYLGLSGEGFFKIPEIMAEVVIIEIFGLYCPSCQSIAPDLKDLYYLIEKNPKLAAKIKMMGGIGAGNSFYEVEVFKKTYDIPFPLFSDKDFVIHEALGSVRTPYFIVIKIAVDGTPDVVLSELGSFEGARSFLETVTTASGL